MLELPPARAARVAYVTAVLNLAAGLAMLLVLRRGLPVPGSAPSARLDFVRGHAGLWRGAWILWHAAAVSLVLLFLVLAERFRRRAPVRAALAMIVAVAGLAADLAAEAILMAVPPAFDERGFEAAEVAAGVLTGYLANGLYTAAGLLLTWAGARQLAWPILLVSVPVWSAGVCLSIASLTHRTIGQVWSTAVLVPFFVLWAALVGRWLKKSAS